MVHFSLQQSKVLLMHPTICLQDVLTFIVSASKEDRKRISSEMAYMRDSDIADAKYSLTRGEVVHFEPNKRGYPHFIIGTVMKINQKTVNIKPNDGGRMWKVTASLLKKGAPPAR